MTQHFFPHLMRQDQAQRIDRLIAGIEQIANAVNRFNDLLIDAGLPTELISIRHKGREMSPYWGETSVAHDLHRLRILDTIERIKIMHPAPQKARAA